MDELGAKILSNLNAAFRKDPEINEYDFVPVMESHLNRNPLIYENHKLGVEIWAVKLLYRHAYCLLLYECPANRRHEPEVLQSLTRAVLLINPDCMTAWNIRKSLVRKGHLDADFDQKFNRLVLTKHPKSPETFAHRKWLFQQLTSTCSTHCERKPQSTFFKTCVSNSQPEKNCETPSPPKPSCVKHERCDACEALRGIVTSECKVCESAADKYPNNYNAWSHRIWISQQVNCFEKEFLQKELADTESFVCRHVSDHSGYHYRQLLLKKLTLLISPEETCNLLHRELEITTENILCYPGHEALWYHRRAVLFFIFKQNPSVMITRKADNTKKTRLDGVLYGKVQEENDFVKKTEVSCKNKWNEILAQRHLDWIRKCLHPQDS